MPARQEVQLDAGKVYRTSHLARWGANPTRLANRLESEGRLEKLSQGLFYAPVKSRFGAVPPSDEALLDAFFDGSPWTLTGPPRWNALGLGSTQLFARPLVYNTKRTGTVRIGRRTFELRRVSFPAEPNAEWYVVDLLRNAESVGLTQEKLATRLRAGLEEGRFSANALAEMAARFGRRTEQDLVRHVTQSAAR
jgi:hypothetical protein